MASHTAGLVVHLDGRRSVGSCLVFGALGVLGHPAQGRCRGARSGVEDRAVTASVPSQHVGSVAVVVAGLLLTDRAGKSSEFGITYPSGVDPEGEVGSAYGVIGMPTTLFITGAGRILERHTGELRAGDLRAALERLTAVNPNRKVP